MNLYNFQLKVLAGLTGLFDRSLWYTVMYIQLYLICYYTLLHLYTLTLYRLLTVLYELLQLDFIIDSVL